MSELVETSIMQSQAFYDRPSVQKMIIPVGPGILLGIEQVVNASVGIAGAYGSWGNSYDNQALAQLVADRLGEPLDGGDKLELASLGFNHRHHIPALSVSENVELELEVGSRFLIAAIEANHWRPEDVDAVMIGLSAPPVTDYIEQISRLAGIRDDALKVTVHKACDSAVSALNLALNPELTLRKLGRNLAEELRGKKVLVGGIEGLSRFLYGTHDKNAMQLFGNGAAVIGVVPGENMQFLVGESREVFDDEGVLAVQMYYPHSRRADESGSLVDITQPSEHHIRVAGMMHEPEDGASVEMAGPMGMVKLFVRTGVQVVKQVYQAYQEKLHELGEAERQIALGIVHHANYKINQLKAKNLQKEGIQFPMPWLLSDFGNVSAASAMIAFLRGLPMMHPGDHILIDGFGAGTYYDVLAVALPAA